MPWTPWRYDNTRDPWSRLLKKTASARELAKQWGNVNVFASHTECDHFPSRVDGDWNPVTFSKSHLFFCLRVHFVSLNFFWEEEITWIYRKRNHSSRQTARRGIDLLSWMGPTFPRISCFYMIECCLGAFPPRDNVTRRRPRHWWFNFFFSILVLISIF